jgi:hypothetical protein
MKTPYLHRISLGYSEVESILATLFGADEVAQKGALRGRLQNLRRLRLPLGEDLHQGRGRHAAYQVGDLWQLGFALELAEFGIDPSLIAAIIRQHWDKTVLPAFERAEAAIREGAAEKSGDRYLFASPSLMSGPWANPDSLPLFQDGTMNDVALFPVEATLIYGSGRVLAFSISRLVRGIREQLQAAS